MYQKLKKLKKKNREKQKQTFAFQNHRIISKEDESKHNQSKARLNLKQRYEVQIEKKCRDKESKET